MRELYEGFAQVSQKVVKTLVRKLVPPTNTNGRLLADQRSRQFCTCCYSYVSGQTFRSAAEGRNFDLIVVPG